MRGSDRERRFDRIAPQYDETREPLDAETLRGLLDALERGGARRLLEVGVGTGRIARPLTDAGGSVVGIDASREMLTRARRKGLAGLVRGSAYRLPFHGASFDAVLFVHVLHVLDHPREALGEAARVGRSAVMALLAQRERVGGPEDPARREEVRGAIRAALVAEGYTPTERPRPWEREREILEALPAETIVPISERITERTPLERIRRMQSMGDPQVPKLSPEAVERVLARLREAGMDRPVPVRRTYVLAIWEPQTLARRLAEAPSPLPPPASGSG